MSVDPELDTWRQQWQAQDAVPADVRRRVERDIRAIRRGLLAAVAVTVVFGGGTIAWAAASGDPDIAAVAAATWGFIAVTWAVSLTIDGRRAQWRPSAATTTAFLEFSIARRIAARRGIVAGALLYAVFSAVMLTWRFHNAAGEAPPDVWSYLADRWIFWIVTAVLAGVAVWRLRSMGRELAALGALRQNP